MVAIIWHIVPVLIWIGILSLIVIGGVYQIFKNKRKNS